VNRPLAVLFIDRIDGIAEHPRQLEIQIDGPAMHQHGSHAQADILEAINQIVPT